VGWTNTAPSVIVANKVVIEGSNGELFVYSGPPALGNLLVAISANGGTDALGNTFSPVIDVAGTFVVDQAGDLLGFNTDGNTTFALVQSEYLAIYEDDGAIMGAPLFAFSNDVFSDPFGNTFQPGLFLGAAGIPTTRPVNGMNIYVDNSGNLKALTQNGNTRTIAAV
jgi:hypothetical protein